MNIAIIFAAGSGTRMGKTILPKPFLTINDTPIIIRTLKVFENCKDIDQIILVVNPKYIDYSKELINAYNLSKVNDIIGGGNTGQESIYNGLIFVEEKYGKDNIVILNDGVRPFVKEGLIIDLIKCTQKNGNAIAAIKTIETVARVDDKIKIPNRDNCYFLKAPQCFYLKELLECHKIAKKENLLSFVDSASMYSFFGKKIFLVTTDEFNIKITTPADLILAKEIIDNKTF